MKTLQTFDGHNDSLLKLCRHGEEDIPSFLNGGTDWDIDIDKMKQANCAGGFFAIFTPAHIALTSILPGQYQDEAFDIATLPLEPEVSYQRAERYVKESINLLQSAERQSNGHLTIIRDSLQLKEITSGEGVAAILHIEGAEAITADLSNLQDYYDQGLRSLGLVWSRKNAFGTGVPFRFPASPDIGPGLTEVGSQLVRECNRLGIMIDLSHLNERGFWDVAAITNKPLVVTHTAAHAICPSARSLTDEQIDAVGESGGVIGIYFAVTGLRRDGAQNPDTPLSLIAEHVIYMIDRIGVDHVALGSDFDGATMPAQLDDISKISKLLKELSAAGLSETDLAKVAEQNWYRVLAETWNVNKAD